MKITQKDFDVLEFMLDRLVLHYNESPNADYLISARAVLNKLSGKINSDRPKIKRTQNRLKYLTERNGYSKEQSSKLQKCIDTLVEYGLVEK
jgi:uncharacterized coiled-coil protein SlyX